MNQEQTIALMADMMTAITKAVTEAVTQQVKDSIKSDIERVLGDYLDNSEGFWHRVKNFIDEQTEETIASEVRSQMRDYDISDEISNWMSDNFDISDYNFDITDYSSEIGDMVTEKLNDMECRVTFE